MKNPVFPLFALLLLLQSCSPAKMLQQAPAYKTGYMVKMRQEIETETEMTMFGETEVQNSKNATEYTYGVVEILPDSRLKWEMNITRYSMENSSASGAMTVYDTADPERDTTNARTQMFDKMIGVPMYMTTTADGRIQEFSGANALFTRVFESFKDKPEMAPFLKTIQNSYGDSAMISTIRSLWGEFPTKPVRIGSQWETTRTMPGIVSLTTRYKYKLHSRDDKKAVITTKSISVPNKAMPSELDLGQIKITYDLSGAGTGDMVLTQPEGRLEKSTHTIQLKGMMHMSGASIPKTDVPIKTQTKVTTEVRW